MRTLAMLRPGQSATIEKVMGEGALWRRFLDMGLLPGAKVEVVRLAPIGDPMQISLRGFNLALRSGDAKKILVAKEGPENV